MSATGPPQGAPTRRHRLLYVGLFAVVAGLAVGAVVVASSTSPSAVSGRVDVRHLPVGPRVPSLADAAGWINSPPLTRADLRGKVVVYRSEEHTSELQSPTKSRMPSSA